MWEVELVAGVGLGGVDDKKNGARLRETGETQATRRIGTPSGGSRGHGGSAAG